MIKIVLCEEWPVSFKGKIIVDCIIHQHFKGTCRTCPRSKGTERTY